MVAHEHLGRLSTGGTAGQRRAATRHVDGTQNRLFLDLLAGRYPSDQFAGLRPRIVWDRIEGTVRARDGAQRGCPGALRDRGDAAAPPFAVGDQQVGHAEPRARCDAGGDALEPCISAASILAKEHRDRIMREAALHHPHYGWERNSGYGTAQHLAALRDADGASRRVGGVPGGEDLVGHRRKRRLEQDARELTKDVVADGFTTAANLCVTDELKAACTKYGVS